MKHGFFRLACASPQIKLADCRSNAAEIIKTLRLAHSDGVECLVFPELSLTGCTCGDLFLQSSLLEDVKQELLHIARETAGLDIVFALGAPIAHGGYLFNCAILFYGGVIQAVIPKTHITSHNEDYKTRHFTAFQQRFIDSKTSLSQLSLFPDCLDIPFGTDILLELYSQVPKEDQPEKTSLPVYIGLEIGEDLWAVSPPSIKHSLAGAQIILNLSASNEIAGKGEKRKLLVSSQSARLNSAYIYADAGLGESTGDLVFAAHNMIAENGCILTEAELYGRGYILQDIDIELLNNVRQKTRCKTDLPPPCRFVRLKRMRSKQPNTALSAKIIRTISPNPFLPKKAQNRSKFCTSIIAIQAEGLAQRLRHTGIQRVLIGLSGGLDSTLAALVCTEAFKRCSLPASAITAVSMPCFGTTKRTQDNAARLAKSLGLSFQEISIEKAVLQHFADIGHNKNIHDAVYENAQARERTQVLMDLANKMNALVIGTGDLSELALGWTTYNGDHMSMYGLNASIPKSLVRYLLDWYAQQATAEFQPQTENFINPTPSKILAAGLAETLADILATPISPELLPPKKGSISQKTEDLVGPYDLHDFFLYYVIHYGFGPAKILFLAQQAFSAAQKDVFNGRVYNLGQIKKWLKVFYRRFFSQQFKRSCMPDGVKASCISLSPRGGLMMPSDALSDLWIKELDSFTGRKNEAL